MKKIFTQFLLMFFVVCVQYTHAQQELIVFSNIEGRDPSEHYECSVKRDSEGATWRKAFVLQTKAPKLSAACEEKNNNEDPNDNCKDDGYYPNLRGWTASWIAFESDFSVPVVVEITKKDAPITQAVVRPAEAVSNVEVKNGKAYVTFYRPANVNVDVNGQMEGDEYTGMGFGGEIHTISLFGNPIYPVPDEGKVLVVEPGKENPIDPDRLPGGTIYFKPGVHRIGRAFIIKKDETWYIPGDAVVHGTIHPVKKKDETIEDEEYNREWWSSSAENFRVYGSGAISGEENVWDGDGIVENKTFTYQASNVELEGFVVIDPANHTFNMNNKNDDPSRLNTYKNLKILGWRKNSDAINAFRHSVVTDCFFRVQDDVFYYGENVKISNIVTWNDANGAVVYLTKGSSEMKDSYIKDISVIYHRAYWHYWNGGRIISMRETPSGRTISNVHISNITVTDPYPAFPPFFARMNNNAVGVNLKNIVFENIVQHRDGVKRKSDNDDLPPPNIPGKPQNFLKGASKETVWKNITFKNCEFNGKRLESFEDGHFDFEYVEKVGDEKISFIVDVDDRVELEYYPNQVLRGESATIQINYSTAEARKLVVYFQDVEHWHHWSVSESRFELPASVRGSQSINLEIDREAPLDKKYQINVAILPVDGGWSERLSFDKSKKIDVVPTDKIVDISTRFTEQQLQVQGGDIIDVTVAFEASQARDLHINLQQKNNGNSYGYKVKHVERSGTYRFDDIRLKVKDDLPPSNSTYILSAFLTPRGLNFSSKVSEVKRIDLGVINPLSGRISTSDAEPEEPLDVMDGEDVLLYPNPVQGLLHLKFSIGVERKISVLNMTGQELYEMDTEKQNVQLDVGSLGISGLMLIHIQSAHGVSTHKVMVR